MLQANAEDVCNSNVIRTILQSALDTQKPAGDVAEALDWFNGILDVFHSKYEATEPDKEAEHISTIRAALAGKPKDGGDCPDWVKAQPHETYEGLKTQFCALKNMINSMGAQISHYSKKDYSTGEKRLAELEASLEIERAMNAKLTEELEAALTPSPDYVMVPRGTVEKLCKFIIQHKDDKFYGDHACAECYPHSELIAAGFQCAYHTAIKMQLSAAPEREG
jgi:hypothetical protein